eukprot:6329796-Amphidinium_carterae.4
MNHMDSALVNIPESEEEDEDYVQENVEVPTPMELENGFEGYEPKSSDAMALQVATPHSRGPDARPLHLVPGLFPNPAGEGDAIPSAIPRPMSVLTGGLEGIQRMVARTFTISTPREDSLSRPGSARPDGMLELIESHQQEQVTQMEVLSEQNARVILLSQSLRRTEQRDYAVRQIVPSNAFDDRHRLRCEVAREEQEVVFEMRYNNRQLPKDSEIICFKILCDKDNNSSMICGKGRACFSTLKPEHELRKSVKPKDL